MKLVNFNKQVEIYSKVMDEIGILEYILMLQNTPWIDMGYRHNLSDIFGNMEKE